MREISQRMLHEIISFLMNPIWVPINLTTTLVVCGYAIFAGAWRERFGGAVYMASALVSWFLPRITWRNSIFEIFVSDLLCLPGLIAINHKSPHAWTRWALCCQGIGIGADIVDLALGGKYFPAYVIGVAVLNYILLAALLIGTISAQVRRRRERDGNQISPAKGEDGSA